MSSSGLGAPALPNDAAPSNSPKQTIRFVQSDGQPHAKRRRINAACQTCRKRKIRCSGEKPTCETCRQNGHICLGYATSSTAGDSQQRQHSPPLDGVAKPARADGGENASDLEEHLSSSGVGPYPLDQKRKHFPLTQSSTPILKQYSDEVPSPVTSSKSIPAALKRSRTKSVHHITTLSQGDRNRLPYFRYFGPTAIVPGFKQMVVQVKEHRRRSTGGQSSSVVDSPSPDLASQLRTGGTALDVVAASLSNTEARTSLEIPMYSTDSLTPLSPLITHLCETFFIHLGCNFPFLQRTRFIPDLQEKRVDAILVDAVCALAARFSTHPLLTTPTSQRIDEHPLEDSEVSKSGYGQAFAQRAKSTVADTFSCPNVAIVQACLLLAYEEFGSNHDSGLWMYLGISIRMAQDLGMQKLEGLKIEGRGGPTPKTAKMGEAGKLEEERRNTLFDVNKSNAEYETANIEDQKAIERERIDTFWAVFFLDRVISSGTGRPVTLRDKDVELSFPSQENPDPITGWPAPFPALIRIIHLYGRVTDLLNNIQELNHVTPETLKRLASMEQDLTGIYQRLSPRLHFNAVNFQHYVKSEQGTNFILLHFWFHTLIVLLHQPTLLHSFEGRIQQLFPNSRELSISSAKTIADILAFAELIDAKSFIGNPFTSQPIYIAACAFLMESAAHTTSNPQSRPSSPSPPRSTSSGRRPVKQTPPNEEYLRPSLGSNEISNSEKDQKTTAKHTLLATAANQNYQRCYKALKSLETYWAGTKYIVTVLDQKAEGIGDPLLYTTEEMESAMELPRPEPAFTTPGWRRKASLGGYSANIQGPSTPGHKYRNDREKDNKYQNPGSPMIDPSQAIGWSLTGTTNSPSSNLTFLYQTPSGETAGQPPPQSHMYNSVFQTVPVQTATATSVAPPTVYTPMQSSQNIYPQIQSSVGQYSPKVGLTQNVRQPAPIQMAAPLPSSGYSSISGRQNPVTTSDAEMLLGLHSPYSAAVSRSAPTHHHVYDEAPSQASSYPHDYSQAMMNSPNRLGYVDQNMMGMPLMIESQEVDMTALALGGEMMPWLEYLPQDVLNFFDTSGDGMGHPAAPPPGPLLPPRSM
ncbi:MAG: hypothetical protein M1827_003333 [Pycnora praestabilis]|nr:MAG: hypothetical protein M1827_003333 [Pycnora praestabilis]